MKSRLTILVILMLTLFTLGYTAERLVLAEYFTNAG